MKHRLNTIRVWQELLLLLIAWMVILYSMAALSAAGLFMPSRLAAFSVHQTIYGLIHFLLFYLAVRYPFPRYLRTRNLPALLLHLFFLATLFTLLKYGIAYFFFRQAILYLGYHDNFIPIYQTFGQYVTGSTWTNAGILCVGLVYVSFRHWLEADKRQQLLVIQKQEAEAGILQMQLSAHFLINSLNSIYSLALANSPQVTDATRTLLHMLTYMTQQPSAADYRSPLREEVSYLEDFIAMHRLRTGCNGCVTLEVQGNPDTYTIAPLLLVPFVENAFKHGVANQPAQPITISLTCTEEQFRFSIHNFTTERRKDKTGGIGLDNVNKRLELVYPGRYKLEIQDTAQDYTCTLQINW